jgi:hypothetical protein
MILAIPMAGIAQDKSIDHLRAVLSSSKAGFEPIRF